VGLEWAHTGSYRSVADDLRIVERLSLDDVHRVLDRWPPHGPSATVLAGPLAADASATARFAAQ
jgi:hypothetical protein